jgi:hypothetical protein
MNAGSGIEVLRAGCFVLLTCGVLSSSVTLAQSNRRAPAVSSKSLDSQAEDVQAKYLAGLADLASKYEEAGDLQKASDMLKGILKVKPDADVVKNKLKQFQESVFNDNVHVFELDAASGWVASNVHVSKDKPVRIEAEGTYKFSINEILGPAGYSGQSMADGLPCGALIAMVGGPGEAPRNRQSRNQKEKEQPHPVLIGASKEFTPNETGTLILRLNLPENARCTGKIKVKISGNFLATR